MPPLDVQLWDYTLIPNPFWGGFLFPTLVFIVLNLMLTVLAHQLSRLLLHHPRPLVVPQDAPVEIVAERN